MGETAGEREGVGGDRLPTATAPHAAPPREARRGSRRPPAPQSGSAGSVAEAGQRRGEAPAPALLHLQLFSKVPPGSATRGQELRGGPAPPRLCRTGRPERGRRDTTGRHSGARSLASAAVPGRCQSVTRPQSPAPARASRPAALPR